MKRNVHPSRIGTHLLAAGLLASLVMLIPGKPAQAAKEVQWRDVEAAISNENFSEAKRLADSMLPSAAPEDRTRLLKAYGHILLGANEKVLARQFLDTAAKAKGDKAFDPQLLTIYRAWLAVIENKERRAESLATLEKIVQSGSRDETAAEAADIMALLYLQQNDPNRAKSAVDVGLRVLEYRGIKSGWTYALLKGRMVSKAKREYDAAERLRLAKRFSDAAEAFRQIPAKYPGDEYSAASVMRLGQCVDSLGQHAKAEEIWRKFIQEAPGGAWRGQAHCCLVDSLLVQPDLPKANEQARTASAALEHVLSAGEVGIAKPSWIVAAADIHLRLGTISLIEKRFDAAIQAFTQVQNYATTKNQPGSVNLAPEVLVGLDHLLEVAQKKTGILPEELNSSDDRAAISLSLGTIYSTLWQYESAQPFFTRIAIGTTKSKSAAHRSYAQQGLARCLVFAARQLKDNKKAESSLSEEILAAYDASLKEHPAGIWNQDSLREAALWLEQTAPERAANKLTQPGHGKPVAAGKKAVEKRPANPDATLRQQKKALAEARAEAIPYWADIEKRFASSVHIPQSLYHRGIAYADTDRSERASVCFEDLVKKHASSPWAGDSAVRLLDVKLELEFDLAAAQDLAGTAITWLQRQGDLATLAASGKSDKNGAAGGAAKPPAPATVFPEDVLPPLKQIAYSIYLRAGLVEYLLEHPKEALAFFDKAKPLQPKQNFVVVQGHIPTGLERLMEVAKANKSLTPEIVRKGDEKARLILMLADVQIEGAQWAKVIELCDLVVCAQRFPVTAEQRSWAHYQKAKALYRVPEYRKAYADYVLAQRTSPNAPWASRALFFAACITANSFQDNVQAVAEFTTVVKKYPKSDVAAKAAYFIGVTYQDDKQWDQARVAFQWFLRNYPDSLWVRAVNEYHLPNVEKQLEQTKSSNTRRAHP